MKKLFITLIIFLFVIVSNIKVFSQSAWTWQHPYPQGDFVTDLHFINQNTGWLTTTSQILKTTNGGSSWDIKNNSEWVFRAIKFLNENTGWACGYSRIYKTTNGGVSWNRKYYTIFPEPFNDIISFDSLLCLAVSDNGVFKTTNGGNNWNWKLNNNNGPLKSFSFVNNYTGWVCGDSGRFYKTTNGGDNWFRQSSGIYKSLNCVYFINSFTGYASGQSGTFIKSTNGGDNWISVYSFGNSYSLKSCTFYNENTGWVSFQSAYTSGAISKTTNGGITWSQTDLIDAINNLSMVDSVNLFSGGLHGILKTSDGNNWSAVSYGLTGWLRTAFFINENTGWFAGGDGNSFTTGVLLKTTNGGNSWIENSNFDYNKINSINFVNSNTGWAVGDNSTIKKTTDGGNFWQQIIPSTGMKFSAVLFTDTLNGWLTGYNMLTQTTVLYKSTNGGLNWNVQYSAIGYELDALSFLNSQTGFVGGGWGFSVGKVLKTTNGGNNWIELNLISNHKILSIYFLNEYTGWAGGGDADGYIYRTTNGGLNWYTHDTLSVINSISFINENTGWAAGEIALFKTTDGGQNWVFTYSGNTNTTSVLFVNQNTGWIFGSNGTIEKTTNGGTVFVNSNVSLIPDKYLFTQNYPNPFNPTTKINFSIPKAGFVSLKIYDITGREVKTLVNEMKQAGYYTVDFNGSLLSSGVYFYRIQSVDFVQTKKLVLVK